MTADLPLAIGPLLVALLMLAVPHITRPDLLFGVPIPRGFRSSEAGRNALRSYRLWIAITLAASLPTALLLASPAFAIAGAMAPIVAGLSAFVAQNRKLKPFAIQPPLIRQTTLGPTEALPWFTWLGLLPLALLAAAAAYLHSHWDRIPARFPAHYGWNGTPDRWAERTVRGVYGPLVFGAEIAAMLFVFAIALWYGSRSNSIRKPNLVLLLVSEWSATLIITMFPLDLAGGIQIPTPLMVIAPLALLIPAVAYAYRESVKPRDPIDPTPNECWKGGMIYYNPDDAALFVQKRDGIGFTLNMANRWGWALVGVLALVLASAVVVLP